MAINLKILFLFVDGLGIGSNDPEINLLHSGRYPLLEKLVDQAVPIDAGLGVKGIPQSATGQATLLTGINAAQHMGRHIEGFPPPTLRKLIESENLFSKLRQRGRHCTFANAYWVDAAHQILLRRRSVTTVMTLAALGCVRGKDELLAGKAVFHDITRAGLRAYGYTGPIIEPATAAEHLLDVAEEHDFTLFEYFLTDRAGHSRDVQKINACLQPLEQFMEKVVSFANQPRHLLILTSDHGNIEDQSIATHTQNPVPIIALGEQAEAFRHATDLTDITRIILQIEGA